MIKLGIGLIAVLFFAGSVWHAWNGMFTPAIMFALWSIVFTMWYKD